MGYEEKILFGLDNIRVCKMSNDSIPIKILGAISVEVEVKQQYKYLYVRGRKRVKINGAIECAGKLRLLGLTSLEQNLIFGHIESEGVAVGENSNSPNLRLLFSREKANGHKIFYCIYNVVFDLSSIDANTTKETMLEDVVEINFEGLKDDNTNLTYYLIDTETCDKNVIDNWFKKIQYPKEVKR